MVFVWSIIWIGIWIALESIALPVSSGSNEVVFKDWRKVCDDFDSFFCTVTSKEDVILIRKYFQNTKLRPSQMVSLTFESTVGIPANVLANFAAQEIVLSGTVYPNDVTKIHTDAFRASQHTAEIIYLNYLNLAHSNFTFLDNFSVLQKLYLLNLNLAGIQSTAYLPAVTYIRLYNCYGLNKWPFPKTLTPSLNTVEIKLSYNDVNFEFADSIPLGVNYSFVN